MRLHRHVMITVNFIRTQHHVIHYVEIIRMTHFAAIGVEIIRQVLLAKILATRIQIVWHVRAYAGLTQICRFVGMFVGITRIALPAEPFATSIQTVLLVILVRAIQIVPHVRTIAASIARHPIAGRTATCIQSAVDVQPLQIVDQTPNPEEFPPWVHPYLKCGATI